MKRRNNHHQKIQRYAELCRYKCANPECDSNSTVEVHHILPVASGGVDDYWNLICLCKKCHHKWKSIFHTDHKRYDVELFVWKSLQEQGFLEELLEEEKGNNSKGLEPFSSLLLSSPLPLENKPPTPIRKSFEAYGKPLLTYSIKSSVEPPVIRSRSLKAPLRELRRLKKKSEIKTPKWSKFGVPVNRNFPKEIDTKYLFYDSLEKLWYISHKYYEQFYSFAGTKPNRRFKISSSSVSCPAL